MLTSISQKRRMFPMSSRLMHRGLEQAAARFGDRDAVLAGDERWSFQDLDRLGNSFAHHLARRGVGSGDRVVVMMTNRPEFVAAVHGISKLGAAAVLLSPAWKAMEVDHAVALTVPAQAIADGAASALLAASMGADRVIDLDDRATGAAVFAESRDERTVAPVADTDESVLVFSSGTTGLPK